LDNCSGKVYAATMTAIKDKLGRPIHDLRISVIDSCNFRCGYCMPGDRQYEFLEPAQRLSFEEIIRLARLFSGYGVRKLRITGGEPLLRRNLPELIEELSSLEGIEDIALTTNGYLLKSHAKALKDAGLHRLTVSLDTVDPDLFQEMSGRKVGLDKVLEGIDAAVDSGFENIKVNCVVQRRVNCHKIIDLAQYFKDRKIIVRFIEFMDVGNQNSWDMKYVVSSKHLLEKIERKYEVEPLDANYYGEVATRYRFKDNGVEFGFISSVTQPFCSSCTRARLSTDGKIYTCLFAQEGTDLKNLLRTGQDDEIIKAEIERIWESRSDQYSQQRSSVKKPRDHKVEMFHIGG